MDFAEAGAHLPFIKFGGWSGERDAYGIDIVIVGSGTLKMNS